MKTLKAFKKLFEAPQSSIKKIDLILSLFPGCEREGLKTNCGALRDLVPCTQYKKREKRPWRSVTFSKVAG